MAEERVGLRDAAGFLIDECRMVLPGIQTLFGFQLIAVFQPRFSEDLSRFDQVLHFGAIGLVVVAIGLIMAPAAMHRHIGIRQLTDDFLDASVKLLMASMVPLAIALAIEVYVIGRLVLKGVHAAPLAIGALALIAFLWIGLPRLACGVRRRHAPGTTRA